MPHASRCGRAASIPPGWRQAPELAGRVGGVGGVGGVAGVAGAALGVRHEEGPAEDPALAGGARRLVRPGTE